MGLEVRTITADELEPWGVAMARGFLSQPHDGWADFVRPEYDLDRVWSAFDGDRVVGTLRSFASELTVPGGAIVPSAALTNVTVASTHRRQGLLRRMLDPDLAAAKERGEPVGMLIAAEFPIYGRFGYGSAADHVLYELDARTIRFANEGTGTVELVGRGHTAPRGTGPLRPLPADATRCDRPFREVVGHHASAHDGAW